MRRLYSNPNAFRRTVSTQSVRQTIEQLQEESRKLDEYMAERAMREKRAQQEQAAGEARDKEAVLDVARANRAVVGAPDKRKTLYRRGKKIKTRTRRLARNLRLTRTKRPARKPARS